jgi:hypothetical protein
MPTKSNRTNHNVDIYPDHDDNWHRWGQLVTEWISGRVPLPDHIGDKNGNPGSKALGLLKQMLDHNVQAKCIGKPDRQVEIKAYPGHLFIPVPGLGMYNQDWKVITGGKPRPYPLPSFYDRIYSGPRKVLNVADRQYIAVCRLGEYVINECM